MSRVRRSWLSKPNAGWTRRTVLQRLAQGPIVFVASITPSDVRFCQLKQVRSQAAQAFGFGSPLRSVDSGMVLHGRHDPVVGAITGPLCQYAAERWRAADASSPWGTHLSPALLGQSVSCSRSGMESCGHWHQAGARAVIGNAVLPANPTYLLTHDGSVVSLMLISPAALKSRVRSAVAFQASRNGLWRIGECDPSLEHQAEALAASGFIDEPTKALLRGKALSALEKACLWLVDLRAARRLLGTTSILRAHCAAKGMTQNAAVQRSPQQGSGSRPPN